MMMSMMPMRCLSIVNISYMCYLFAIIQKCALSKTLKVSLERRFSPCLL